MPIFEYVCRDCRKRFEALIYGSKSPICPLCNGTSLDQQISVFSVGSTRPAKTCAAAAGCGGSCAPVAAGGCCPMD